MLAEILLGAQRSKLLALLLLNPESSWHVREIARRLQTQPGTLNRDLTKLAACGVLLRHRVGNQVHYRADRASPVFAELAGFLRKTSGLIPVLSDALSGFHGVIQSAVVFGSTARGEERRESDIDLLILGDVNFAEVVEAVYPAQAFLQREINPVVYRAADFRQKLMQGNSWAREVVGKPKLFVIGTADDFGELVGHPALDAPGDEPR